MKKIALIITLVATFATAQIITIIDNGVKRKISVDTPTSGVTARAVDSIQEKKEIIVAFKDGADINDFANKYNLELKTKSVNKYYIFKNNSSLSDSELIAKVLEEDAKIISTIRPNWGFGFMAR